MMLFRRRTVLLAVGIVAGAAEKSAFTDSRERAMNVRTPRIVPKGTKRHSMQAVTRASE
jgi:hypothetical protein